jgi:hypothetical protein
MHAIAKYEAVFGRAPAILLEPSGDWGVSALDKFEAAGVLPVFDFARSSAV